MYILPIFLMLGVIHSRADDVRRYKPIWADLDSRPLPQWYDRAKVGIFIHWGVFSVPSFGSEWFWQFWHKGEEDYVKFMKDNYPPNFTYQDFAAEFKASFFNATEWAEIFKDSGAKYVVLTSKHHEGFTLWPSKRSFSWNSVDTGPRRDIVLEVSKAVKKTGLTFGLYHSLFEWFNSIYLEDQNNNFTTRTYVQEKVWPDLQQIVNDYQPSVIWSDGDTVTDEYWNSTHIVSWLYNESPKKNEIVVNDRWATGMGKHGDFYTNADRFNPGYLLKHKWENCFTIDKYSWGFRRSAALSEYMTMDEIIWELVTTVSCGGNVLINVGPTKDGLITPIYEERLLSLGNWLKINGESIYGTSPWISQNDTFNGDNVWYTCLKYSYNGSDPISPPPSGDKVKAVYVITLKWPEDELLIVKDITQFMKETTKVTLIDGGIGLKWKKIDGGKRTEITFPPLSKVRSRHAWAMKIVF